MKPFEGFAVGAHAGLHHNPTPAWSRTAPVLQAWAPTAGGSGIEQSEAINTHRIRVWSGPALALVPELAPHAAALRAAPCVADWDETARIADEASTHAVRLFRGKAYNPAANSALNETFWPRWKYAAHRTLEAVHLAARTCRQRGLPDPVPQATEEWILLTRPAVPPLYAALVDPYANPDPDLYAVAWDALAARLDPGNTDDGVRVRDGRDRRGAPVPVWARRTALARCLVRR